MTSTERRESLERLLSTIDTAIAECESLAVDHTSSESGRRNAAERLQFNLAARERLEELLAGLVETEATDDDD